MGLNLQTAAKMPTSTPQTTPLEGHTMTNKAHSNTRKQSDPLGPVVFDLGGVLFRWQPLVLLQDLFAQRVPTVAVAQTWAQAIFQSFDPLADWALFDLGQIEPLPLAQRIAARIAGSADTASTGITQADVLRLIEGIAPHLQPIAGTVQLLQDLKAQGHRLYYLSNMPAGYAAHLVAHNAFFALFEAGLFSAHVQQIKPLPGIFATAQAQWALQAQGGKPVFIDDVQHNIDAAHAHGWGGIRFESPEQTRAALVARGYLPG
jgi:putative hydrolase of the HAD superfamily